MPYSIDEGSFGRPLPTDITLRIPAIYRRRGVVASLLSAVGTWATSRRLNRMRRPYRPGRPPPLPDYLRQDVGLPPLPERFPEWWEIR